MSGALQNHGCRELITSIKFECSKRSQVQHVMFKREWWHIFPDNIQAVKFVAYNPGKCEYPPQHVVASLASNYSGIVHQNFWGYVKIRVRYRITGAGSFPRPSSLRLASILRFNISCSSVNEGIYSRTMSKPWSLPTIIPASVNIRLNTWLRVAPLIVPGLCAKTLWGIWKIRVCYRITGAGSFSRPSSLTVASVLRFSMSCSSANDGIYSRTISKPWSL